MPVLVPEAGHDQTVLDLEDDPEINKFARQGSLVVFQSYTATLKQAPPSDQQSLDELQPEEADTEKTDQKASDAEPVAKKRPIKKNPTRDALVYLSLNLFIFILFLVQVRNEGELVDELPAENLTTAKSYILAFFIHLGIELLVVAGLIVTMKPEGKKEKQLWVHAVL